MHWITALSLANKVHFSKQKEEKEEEKKPATSKLEPPVCSYFRPKDTSLIRSSYFFETIQTKQTNKQKWKK